MFLKCRGSPLVGETLLLVTYFGPLSKAHSVLSSKGFKSSLSNLLEGEICGGAAVSGVISKLTLIGAFEAFAGVI